MKQIYSHRKTLWLPKSFTRDFVPRINDIIRFDEGDFGNREKCKGWYRVTAVVYHPLPDTVVVFVEDKGRDAGWPENVLKDLAA